MTKKFFLIAAETSGDIIGSKLIRELKLKNPGAEFTGIGGELMQKQGLTSIFAIEELSVMGFAEIVPHIPKLLRLIAQTAAMIRKIRPDFIITIDAPDFCFRVMKKLQHFHQAKKIHLVAPSIWAYRAGRAKKIARLYDLLLTILPFEPPYFTKYGLKTVFIGHPVIEDAPDFSIKKAENLNFRKKHGLSADNLIICLTPGSRNSEVAKIFPEFIGAINLLAQEKPDLKVIIPLVKKTSALVCKMAKTLKVQYFLIDREEKKQALFACNFAVAKSGTNAIELSLYQIPLLVAYKVNFLTFFLLKMMIKVRFANLINLILNREIIPEMLQKNCQAQKILHCLKNMIDDESLGRRQIVESAAAFKLLGLGNFAKPSLKAAEEILKIS
jgi:lipid-A-disaccharide synthase